MRSLLACKPRIATERTDRPTKGGEVAKVAEMLGTPLMPHQQLVVDVALEENEDGTPAYQEVVLTVPRQSGKSALVCALMVWNALRDKRQVVAYTAQTGSDARRKLKNDFAPMVVDSDLGKFVRVYQGIGAEMIKFDNGSRIEPLPSTLTAGHGLTLSGGAFIDEAMADVDDRREQALLPTMATCRNAQLWVVSTAGTEQSAYLNRKTVIGREAVANGRTSGIAYFEWSAAEGVDPDNEDAWYEYMPALGHTIGVEKIRHARQTMSDGEFRRAYMNQPTKIDDRVVPAAAWDEVQTDRAWPDAGLVFGVDVTLDRSRASIVVADSAGVVELVENRDGTGWVADRVRELVAKHGGRVVVDGYSPAANLIDEMPDVSFVKYVTRDAVSACNSLFDAIMQNKNLRVRPHDALTSAIGAAQKKPMGSSWLWARTDPAADLSPLHAMSVAWHCAMFKPVTDRKPVIF